MTNTTGWGLPSPRDVSFALIGTAACNDEGEEVGPSVEEEIGE